MTQKPFFKDSLTTLYNCDSSSILELFPKNALTIYDPPFDIWDDVSVVTTDQMLAFTNQQRRHSAEAKLGRPRIELVWFFQDGRWVSSRWPRLTHEYIYIYGETGEAMVGEENPDCGKITKKGTACIGKDKLTQRVYVAKEKKQLNSVLCFPRNMKRGAWAKPPKLAAQLLDWVRPSFVCDPFSGSGVFLLEARKRGIPNIGCEIDAMRCEKIVASIYAVPEHTPEQITDEGDDL